METTRTVRSFVAESRGETLVKPWLWVAIALLATEWSSSAQSSAITTSEHRVRAVSKVPSIAGQAVRFMCASARRPPPIDIMISFGEGGRWRNSS
jgi:hypothetical protein